jgi:acyl-CoA synthetase (NDP forming)
VIFTPPLVTQALDVAGAVREATEAVAAAGYARPVVASFLGASEVRQVLGAGPHPVPCFAYPENAVRALAHGVRYATWRQRPEAPEAPLEDTDANEARRLCDTRAAGSPAWVTGHDAMEVLAAYGIPVLATARADGAAAAAAEAGRLGFPVALKAWGADLVHKSEHGGVVLNLPGPAEVEAAYRRMEETLGGRMAGAELQPMQDGGVETITGFVQDPAFGPQVVFGLGGTAVEIMGDAVTRLAPLSRAEARAMVLGLRGTQLLLGFRGSPPVDVDALVDVVMRMSKLAADLPEIVEADCNPVLARPDGAVVVDARLRVDPGAALEQAHARHLR